MRWLRLIRLPTVFTAMADIFLGFLLVSGGEFQPLSAFAFLLGASSCLYFAGMVLNDVFDLQKDLAERPDRPLPSGTVSLRAAWLLAVTLCLTGVTLAWLVSSRSAIVAAGIVVAVFGYDWLLKNTPLAPLAMGSCRLLNVLLGASAAATGFEPTTVLIAAGLGCYIAGLTWFARREVAGLNGRDLIGGSIVMNAAVVALAICVWFQARPGSQSVQVIVLLLFVLTVIDVRLIRAIRFRRPADIGGGIRTALLSLVVIDASLVLAFTHSIGAAVATAALLIPASVIRRWIPLT